jgi:hypothetical protein
MLYTRLCRQDNRINLGQTGKKGRLLTQLSKETTTLPQRMPFLCRYRGKQCKIMVIVKTRLTRAARVRYNDFPNFQ